MRLTHFTRRTFLRNTMNLLLFIACPASEKPQMRRHGLLVDRGPPPFARVALSESREKVPEPMSSLLRFRYAPVLRMRLTDADLRYRAGPNDNNEVPLL